jgi:hypothetical protein
MLIAGNSDEKLVRRHEIALGIGLPWSSEDNLFNVPQDVSVSPNYVFTVLYYYNINEHMAVGGHVYGYNESVEGVIVTDASGMRRILDFDLNSNNIGGRARWTFTRKWVQPYSFLGLSLTRAGLESDPTGRLLSTGIALTGGSGATVNAGSRFALSLEGMVSLGTANWEQRPFANSSGEEFDPSMFGILAVVSFLWGHLPVD